MCDAPKNSVHKKDTVNRGPEVKLLCSHDYPTWTLGAHEPRSNTDTSLLLSPTAK